MYCVLALMVSRHPGVQTETHRNGRYRPAFPYSQEMQSCGPSQKKYRAQAREYEEPANGTNDPMLKKARLDLARQFHEVADRLERHGS
jgi:hypothetical protein